MRRRWVPLLTVVVVLTAGCLALGVVAERTLMNGPGPWLGPVRLQLAYNPGVAFSLGDTLPRWVVTAVTGAITLAVAIFTWRVAATANMPTRLGLTAILTGALANLIDRAVDGTVIDYLHTGWFPTFNLPDVFLTAGSALLLLGALRAPPRPEPAEGP